MRNKIFLLRGGEERPGPDAAVKTKRVRWGMSFPGGRTACETVLDLVSPKAGDRTSGNKKKRERQMGEMLAMANK